ncbi:N-6 DNA methylase [Cupriavidus sp. WS]|uniref:N-6 DNA methylase n=1 Tax=Cupriavidus sp. WS TaxID=1312922 RepID=UPI00036E7EA5|nr:N-6 DNA methylase [Cupriavidus sp. WS]
MSKAAKRRLYQDASEPHKALLGMFNVVGRRHAMHEVFSDFVEMSALAISNAVDRHHFEEREERYLAVAKKYGRDELTLFPEMLGALTLVFEERVQTWVPSGDGLGDILGQTFMMLDLGNSGTGQFFTPYSVSRTMARMTIGDGKPFVERDGFVTLLEPTCGAGGMVIACADALHDAGLNHQQAMHATCIDIDPRCVHMTYLQMALLHIPGIVIHGNGLTGESWSRWFTPAHILGGWGRKLRRHRQDGEADAPMLTDDISEDVVDEAAYPLVEPGTVGVASEPRALVSAPAIAFRVFVPDDQLALF